MKILGRIALWLCQAILAAMFIAAGASKFGSPMWARLFARWGYPDHFYLVVGAIEVTAAIGLLWPRTAAISALVLLTVMAGAGMTHLVHGELERLTQIAVMSSLLGIVAYARWRRVRVARAAG